MGSKKINGPYQMPWSSSQAGPFVNNTSDPSLNVGMMSGTNTIYAQPQNVQNFDNIAIQFSWTGSAVGTITISQSVDGIIYDDLVLSPPITQPSGSPGHWSVDLNQMPAPWIQVYYTNTSGSGVLTAKLFSKDIN